VATEAASSAPAAVSAAVSAALDRLVAAGLAERAAGAFRLTAAGKLSAGELLSADAAAWGASNAISALDAFLVLDRRMKDVVTAWQTREVDGNPVANDHSDIAYDAGILERLAALHGDARRWLRGLDAAPARMTVYAERLDTAAALAEGDGRYVASPRVDSYHGIWFELHEDLIRLAGRSRAEEVAAGRA
jgi:pyruvate,orthophosphate dikinase